MHKSLFEIFRAACLFRNFTLFYIIQWYSTISGFAYFGVREEYDLSSLQKKDECQVYLARVGVGQSRVPMSVQMVTSVTPGLSSECSPVMSTRVSFTVSFCAEEWSCDDDHVTTAATNDDDDYEDCEDTEDDCDIWAEADNQDNCPGEWGCVGTDHEEETEMTTEISDTDVVDVIYSTLMSETMTPVTITVLMVLGLLLLLAMWCLICRGRHCCSCHHCHR